MNDAKLVNIAKLMTTYNFEIEQLPDNLKCTQCKLVLKDACYVVCCCRYCRICINDMMTRGCEFCSGRSDECGESPLSRHQSDYLANKGVSRVVVKCPHDGCVHKCQLVNIEEHLRECQRNSEECPFREFGCTQDKLAAEEMGGHLQNENRRHSEILIGMIASINREIETFKLRDEASSKEIEMLKQRDSASSKEIEMLKLCLVLKDEQIRSIIDQMIHLQNENKSIKNDIKLIKEEKEDLAGRVTILTEKIEREIVERVENDELGSARVIDHVDREIAAVTLLIISNKNELVSEMQSLRCNIGSRNQDVQSMKDDICSLKQKMQSVQASSKGIEMLKQRDEASSKDIDMLKHGLVMKDEQIRSIMDQMIYLQNENKSMKNDIKLIKEEKEDLAGRVTILTDKIEQEIAERVENNELDSARVIDHVDREIAAVTLLIGSNKDEFVSEMQSLRVNIGSRNQDVQSIKDDICCLKRKLKSVQLLVGLGQVDASFVWLIDENVDKMRWGWKESEYFAGEVHPYKYRLVSGNYDIGTARAVLWVRLQIHASLMDGQLAWPFEARVVITITDRYRRDAGRSISLQCRIERSSDNQYRSSDPFQFRHSELRESGLNLSRGVRVSCMIVSGTG